MRRLIAGAVAVACGGGAGQALAADVPVKAVVQSIDQLWNISYNSEVRYFSWQNTRGFPTNAAPLNGTGHGTQLFTPMSLSLTGNPNTNWKLEFVLLGGLVSSSQSTSGERGSVDTPVDSQLSGTATYSRMRPRTRECGRHLRDCRPCRIDAVAQRPDEPVEDRPQPSDTATIG